MAEVCTVGSCDYPRSENAWICRNCERALAKQLADIPALLDELDITLCRSDAIGAGNVRRSAEQPLPFKVSAGDTRWLLDTTVTTWARLIAEERGVSLPANTTAEAAEWLHQHLQAVSMSEAAGEAVDEVAHAVDETYRAIDRPPDLLLAGPCRVEECPAWLYARPGQSRVRCPDCGVTHDVHERREWMMTAAGNMRVTASVALSWVRLLTGVVIPKGTWRSWRSRGRLSVAGLDRQGHERFRFADVHELTLARMQHKTHTRHAVEMLATV